MRKGRSLSKNFLISGIISLSFFACKSAPPKIEHCILNGGDSPGCVCIDSRLGSGEYPDGTTPIGEDGAYFRPLEQCNNYIAISPSDYEITQDWLIRKCGRRR